MTWDNLVGALDTPNKALWNATVHELLTSLPESRGALLDGLTDDRLLVRAGCAAALDHDGLDVVIESERRSKRFDN